MECLNVVGNDKVGVVIIFVFKIHEWRGSSVKLNDFLAPKLESVNPKNKCIGMTFLHEERR